MCNYVTEKASISGSGKGTQGWFPLRQVSVSYDHPFNAPLDHALNIDFVNEAEGLSARVAGEVTPDSARQLVKTIRAALDRGEGELQLPTREHATAG